MAFHFKPLKIDFSLLKGWNMIVIFSENSFLYFWNIHKVSYIFGIYKKPLVSSEYTPLGGGAATTATTATTAAATTAREEFPSTHLPFSPAQEKIYP